MTATRTFALSGMLTASLIVGGCAYDRHPEIPNDAMMMAEGDKTLTQRFNEPGTVYIFDRNNNEMIYAGKVDAGQTLTVEPDKDRISIDGRTVYDMGLSDFETRRVFFKPEDPSRKVIVEERRVLN
jgi:hypothetical protein